MEKLEKAFDNYVLKAIVDYKRENYNGNIVYMKKIAEQFNKIDGEMKVFNEAFNQRLNHIEEYLLKSFTRKKN